MQNNIEITDTANALSDADEILRVTRQMKTAFEDFDGVMRRYAGGNIKTAWADTLLQNWNKYQNDDIPGTLAAMELSAENIRNIVAESVAYSNEQNG